MENRNIRFSIQEKNLKRRIWNIYIYCLFMIEIIFVEIKYIIQIIDLYMKMNTFERKKKIV